MTIQGFGAFPRAMDCNALPDDQWEPIKRFVPGTKGTRLLLEALLWMARFGETCRSNWRLRFCKAAILSLNRDGRASVAKMSSRTHDDGIDHQIASGPLSDAGTLIRHAAAELRRRRAVRGR